MTVTVAVLHRRGDRYRDRWAAVVRRELHRQLPDADHVTIDTDHDPYNLAAARNRAVRVAEANGSDVVVLSDADVIADTVALTEAIDQAGTDGLVHLPFDYYRALTKEASDQWLSKRRDPRGFNCVHESDWSSGGLIVATPAAWWLAGGADEGFSGWGFEDAAFALACTTMVGEMIRHRGDLVHLWHPSAVDFESPTYIANRDRCLRYEAAAGDKTAMRALIEGRA